MNTLNNHIIPHQKSRLRRRKCAKNNKCA